MTELKEQLLEILKEKEQKIIPKNIKEGVQIFDIIGECAGGTDTSDATATADDIAKGKTAYVNGEKINGTIPLDEAIELAETIIENKPYIELEYITSDGKAYIDTGVQALATIGVELNVKCTNTKATAFFGAWSNQKGIIFGQAYYSSSVQGYAMAANGSWVFPSNTSNFDTTRFHKYIYDPINNIYTIDGGSVNLIKNTGLNTNMWIFRAYEWTEMGSDISISNCKIYDNGVLIKDYIPVIRKSDNVICMYDLVNKEFAVNSGNGTFSAGQEKEKNTLLTDVLNIIVEEKQTKIIPENIKAGVQIFDTEGEYTGLDTSDATATAGDIAKDKTAYVNGEKVVGAMEVTNNSDYNVELHIPSQYVTQFSFISLLKKVDLSNINTAQLLNFASAFSRASDMIEVKGIDVSHATTLNSMFYQCGELVHIPVLNPASVKNANSLTEMFTSCSSLSDESLNNILQMCVNAINYTGTKTLQQIGLSSEQATKCTTLSNYQAFLNAGWTTGY